MKKIDTHQHLIYPDRFRYPWLADVPALQGRGFTLDDYRAAAGKEIAGSLFMEVDVAPEQSADEARFFCQMAENPEHHLLGVVASARPEAEKGFEDFLDAIAHPALKGIRRVLHTQDDGLSQRPCFRRHAGLLGKRKLTFDLCVLPRQLPLAVELVDVCPATRFMLDHCGVPDIAGGSLIPWSEHLRELARRPHVFCKLSGIVAYAKPGTVSVETLHPWVEHALECFGPERMMWGGDWPVCNLGSSLGEWVDISARLLAELSVAEQERIFYSNALDFYNLRPPSEKEFQAPKA